MKLKGLGRGLDALLAGNDAQGREQQRSLPVGQIQPGKYQPRTHMDAASLEELAASIRAQGLMQPILVRPLGEELYEIIAGERRWRAAQMAGMSEVSALIREIPDEAALAMALIENIQRENLNPLEEALGLQRLIDEFAMTHQQAADAVGRSRPAASNLLRLLQLAPPVQELLMRGEIDMGHARALLPLSGALQVQLAQRVVQTFAAELDPHFCVEEQGILVLLAQAGQHDLVARTLADHTELRRLARALATPDADTLLRFAELLGTHVRFEEREVFEAAQARLAIDPVSNEARCTRIVASGTT